VLNAGLRGDYVSRRRYGRAPRRQERLYDADRESDSVLCVPHGAEANRGCRSVLAQRPSLAVRDQSGALDYMKERALSEATIAEFAEMRDRVFESKEAWGIV